MTGTRSAGAFNLVQAVGSVSDPLFGQQTLQVPGQDSSAGYPTLTPNHVIPSAISAGKSRAKRASNLPSILERVNDPSGPSAVASNNNGKQPRAKTMPVPVRTQNHFLPSI